MLQWLVDAAAARWPRRVPDPALLSQCCIVSHRGEHDNDRVLENTEAAFARALDAGVWGIELDVRWTADLEPVVFHDACTARLYGHSHRISALTRKALQRRYPAIPTLASLVRRFGKRAHLMVELKSVPGFGSDAHNDALRAALSPLEPVADYHLLSLDPEVLAAIRFAPRRCRIPIAEFNVGSMSELALREGYAGLSGHYLLIGNGRLRRHQLRGQAVGTGFVQSRYGLYREVARGVDWVFSDTAARVQGFADGTGGRTVPFPPAPES
jgi:glycerophosphoryl diester phosphodiesterase